MRPASSRASSTALSVTVTLAIMLACSTAAHADRAIYAVVIGNNEAPAPTGGAQPLAALRYAEPSSIIHRADVGIEP